MKLYDAKIMLSGEKEEKNSDNEKRMICCTSIFKYELSCCRLLYL